MVIITGQSKGVVEELTVIASHTSASWMGSSEHLVLSSCMNGGLGGGGRRNLGGGPHPGPHSKSVSNISHMNVLDRWSTMLWSVVPPQLGG